MGLGQGPCPPHGWDQKLFTFISSHREGTHTPWFVLHTPLSPCPAPGTAWKGPSCFPGLAACVNTAQLRDHGTAPSALQHWALIPTHYLHRESEKSLISSYSKLSKTFCCFSGIITPCNVHPDSPVSDLYSLLKFNFLLPSTQMLSVIATPFQEHKLDKIPENIKDYGLWAACSARAHLQKRDASG